MANGEPGWLLLVWRLPTGSSTPRVTIWRRLQRLGTVTLTPGAALLPFREDLQEQLDWVAQEVEEMGGAAWVLPVTELAEAEERKVRERSCAERQAEYQEIREDAREFLSRAPEHPEADGDYAQRLRTEKELLALQRRFRKVRTRDYFNAPGGKEAAETVDRCLAFRQGISSKLKPVTDEQPV
jgi:hypothetical protein